MSLNQLPQHETIAPLIKVCRKLEHCDKHQLSEWIQTFPDIFSQNNSLDLWIKILLKGLCCYHASIPTALFDAILATAPNENALHCLDDSITKSHLNDETETDDIETDEEDTKQPLTLLQIPEDSWERTLTIVMTLVTTLVTTMVMTIVLINVNLACD
eukprot:310_1